MKELLHQFASYNVWANQRMAEITKTLPEQLLTQKVVGSFPSVRSTILHMVDAESIWWQRVIGSNKIERPSDAFAGTTEDALQLLMEQNIAWRSWVEQAGTTELTGIFSYRNLKNEQFSQPFTEVLLHIFNHGTYHRGQWVNQLRECGVDKLPATDFIVFARQSS